MKSPLSTVLLLALAGCVGVKVSPAARAVRRVALVSVSIEPRFEDLTPKDPNKKEKEEPLNLKSLLKDAVEVEESFVFDDEEEGAKARAAILTRAVEAYAAALRAVGWEVTVASPTLTVEPEPNRFPAAGEAAPGMTAVEVDSLVSELHLFQQTKNIRDKVRAALAAAARELDVDAVAAVALRPAYARTGKSVGVITGRAVLRRDVGVVSREGELIASVSAGTCYNSSKSVPLLSKKGTLVDLTEAGPAIRVYDDAVDKSAEAFQESLAKALSK